MKRQPWGKAFYRRRKRPYGWKSNGNIKPTEANRLIEAARQVQCGVALEAIVRHWNRPR